MGKRVIVAGAGAAGLTAAIFAARSGASVTVLESMDRPGKKLLLTGNGRCNMTNLEPGLPKRYHGTGTDLAESVIRRFGVSETLRFFSGLGLLTFEKNGYVYPYTAQSSSVLEVLLKELRRLKIKLKLTEKIVSVEKNGGLWQVRTDSWAYEAEAVILACGSRALPSTGSDGSGYLLAKTLGHQIVKPAPALAPVVCKGDFFAGLAGVRCRAAVSLYEEKRGRQAFSDSKKKQSVQAASDCEEKQKAQALFEYEEKQSVQALSDCEERQKARTLSGCEKKRGEWTLLGRETGELQWTKYGVSGIAVFSLSRFVSARDDCFGLHLFVDLVPDFTEDFLAEKLADLSAVSENNKLASVFDGILHEKLIPVVLRMAGVPPKSRCGEMTASMAAALAKTAKNMELTVTGTKSFDSCQVCAGGVDCREVWPETLESKKAPGLYFCGELLDVDGPCGGYNLQWAWSSGYAAGTAAAKAAH